MAILKRAAFIFALMALGPVSGFAANHALVIGIDRYDNLPADKQLKKAVNDSRSIAQALRELDFTVEHAENVTRREFYRLWARLMAKLQPGDVAALYFSGHGVDLDGVYLMPRDVQALDDETGLKADAIPLRDLLGELRNKRLQISFQIIDACRDNPFSDPIKGRSLGTARGLSRPENAEGNFIMYSADERQRALDRLSDADENPNSVYTRNLLPLLKKGTGLSLDEIAKGVRSKTRELARTVGHTQFPAYYNALTDDWYPGGKRTDSNTSSSPPQPSDEVEWAAINQNSIAQLEYFASRHASSRWVPYAKARIAELEKAQRPSAPVREPEPKPRSETAYNFVWDTQPPDDWLDLRTSPGGSLIKRMPNGTALEILGPKSGKWLKVRVVETNDEGWAAWANNSGSRVWIYCCRTLSALPRNPRPYRP